MHRVVFCSGRTCDVCSLGSTPRTESEQGGELLGPDLSSAMSSADDARSAV